MPDKTGEKQVRTKFQKGHSGNPNGRPKGARSKSTLLAEALLENNVVDICNRLIVEAKGGNMQAIKIVIDRILPPRKDHPITIDLPQIKTSSDILIAISLITNAVGAGANLPQRRRSVIKNNRYSC